MIFRFDLRKDGGPNFGPDSAYYSTQVFLEANTRTANWPTHDPCGNNHQNHVKGVANPGGAIYIGPDAVTEFDDSGCLAPGVIVTP